MKKTVLITGASSGIGWVTAEYFARNNWNVVATMRHPDKRNIESNENITYLHLDVTDKKSIADAINTAVEQFNKIDVVINNAGYALYGVFEAFEEHQIKKQYETNVFGLINVTQAVLPHFRKMKQGCIINISSMGGIAGFPLYSLYQSTKFAVEGLSESLSYELQNLNIRIKLIEPGVIKTNFYTSSLDEVDAAGISDYSFMESVYKQKNAELGKKGSDPILVAKMIYKAANDKSSRLRYPVGSDAKLLYGLRKILPLDAFRLIIKSVFSKK